MASNVIYVTLSRDGIVAPLAVCGRYLISTAPHEVQVQQWNEDPYNKKRGIVYEIISKDTYTKMCKQM